MSGSKSILAFAGSTRSASVNKKVLAIASEAARRDDAEVTVIDLRDFPLPIYDGDQEAAEGVPENALKLKRLFKAHRGLLIATPEYNTSISGVLKNAIDWVTRPVPDEPHLACFNGKIAALLSASLGPMGGIRAQAHLRQILSGIGVTVIPEHWGVPGAKPESFDDGGALKDATGQAMVQRVGEALSGFLGRLAD
ncbi:MAG: NAD(P)H-dependent oxidoreductase [Pseudomonadales bacterium]